MLIATVAPAAAKRMPAMATGR